jgi:hypothetical protein
LELFVPRKTALFLTIGCVLLSYPAFAGKLTEGRVIKIIRDVKVVDPAAGNRPANGSARADVFTNHANYTGCGGHGSTTGTFGGQGANTYLLNGPPGY